MHTYNRYLSYRFIYNHCLVTQNLLQNTPINVKMSASYRLAKPVADAWQCIIAFRLRIQPEQKSASEDSCQRVATVNITLSESSRTLTIVTHIEEKANR